MKRFIRNAFGVSAMELVLGGAVAGAAALGGAALVKSLGNQSKGSESRNEVREFTDAISKLIVDKVSCRNSFTGVNAANGSVDEIKDKDGNVKFKVGEAYGINQLKLVSIKLVDMPGLEDAVEVIPGDEGSTKLELKFAQQKEGAVEIRRTLTLFTATSATGEIRECFASNSGSGSFWIKNETDPTKIYYDEGYVGVGAENPRFPMDVNGPVAIRSGGDALTLTGTAAEFEMTVTDPAKPIQFVNGATGTAADFTAGNMTVGSYIKLTNAGACDASNNGTIRYNSSSKQVEMCESGSWVVKPYEEWCVPYFKRKEQDDNGMYFHQADNARREKGTGCDRVQIDDREDNTKYSDLKIGAPDYGHRIRHDHSSDPCVNDVNCRTWRDVDQ